MCGRFTRKSSKFLQVFTIIICSITVVNAQPLIQKAVIHFDASLPDRVQIDQKGCVQNWKSVNSDAVFEADNESRSNPLYVPAALNKLSAIKFDGQDDLLKLTNFKSEINQKGVTMFVVAKFDKSKESHYVLSTGEQLPFMKLYSDTNNFRFETGDKQVTRRCGMKIDEDVHVFEYCHSIPDDYTRLWPGDFQMDATSCGKVFDNSGVFAFENCFAGSKDGLSGFFKGLLGEIIIFDHKLDDDQRRVIRKLLADKWGAVLNKEWTIPNDLPVLKEIPVGPAGKFSSFGMYDQSPESPDGKRIAYIVLDEPFTPTNNLIYYSLWVCDSNFENHREVIKSPTPTNCHNGGFIQWVDNDSLAMCGSHGVDPHRKILVVNVDTGKIEHGPFTGGFLGDDNYGGKVLMNITSESELGEKGLYELDTISGKTRCIFKQSDFAYCYEKYKWSGQPDTDKWNFSHSKYSRDGSHLLFTIDTGRGGCQHLISCKSDLTDIRIWGRLDVDKGADKPLHKFWYDGDTIVGVDQETEDGTPHDLTVKRWDRDANYIETLAGYGCHIGMSPDKKWIASENFYRTEPVYLMIYKSGELVPSAIVFNYPDGYATWKLSGHVNPSFSRDSKRIYYSRPVDGKLIQAYCCDFSNEL